MEPERNDGSLPERKSQAYSRSPASTVWAASQRRKVIVIRVAEAIKHTYEITRANGSKEIHVALVPSGDGEEHVIAELEPGDTIRQVWLPPNHRI